MTKNVIGFPKATKKARVNYKGLLRAFRRINVERRFELVKADELPLLPNGGGVQVTWYTCRYAGPGSDYREAGFRPLKDFGLAPELLIYRVLRDLYGLPDCLTVGVVAKSQDQEPSNGDPGMQWEWGFLLAGQSDAIFEIRKQPGTQHPYVAIWLPRMFAVDEAATKNADNDLKTLVRELQKTLHESPALVDSKDVKKASTSIGPINVYADLLAAGDDQLAAAKMTEVAIGRTDREGDRSRKLPQSVGTFFMAAAIQYLLAFEAYVNVVDALLRKDEFSDKLYDRLAQHADFESRLLALPLFCKGFERPPFTPDMPLFKRVRELRKFRNEVLHGSFSDDDHVIRLLTEDNYFFYWWPAVDEAAVANRDGSARQLPLARGLFRRRHTDIVRRDVELAVEAIISAMQPDYRGWAESWRASQTVPAVLSAGMWRPSLDRRDPM